MESRPAVTLPAVTLPAVTLPAITLSVVLLVSGCLFTPEDSTGSYWNSRAGTGVDSVAPAARETVVRQRLEDTYGPGSVIAWATGTVVSKNHNRYVSVPLGSWYVREQDRKGMGLLGGALAYDMVTTRRVNGQAVSKKLVSHGLFGVAGQVEERQLDGSGAYRKCSWLFPFYRYVNVNGERTLYPLFFFPVPLGHEERAFIDPAPWDTTADSPIDPAEDQVYSFDRPDTAVTLRPAPQAASTASIPSTAYGSRSNLRKKRSEDNNATREDPNRAGGAWHPRSKSRAQDSQYRVRRGDTLSSIARKHYGNASGWKKIYQANRGVLQSPNRIRVGMELAIPARE